MENQLFIDIYSINIKMLIMAKGKIATGGKLSAFSKKAMPTASVEKKPEARPTGYSPFPKHVAVFCTILHTCFFAVIIVWGLNSSILAPHSADWIIRLIEMPGALFVDLIGQGSYVDSTIPYVVVFFIGSIFYAAVGYGLGLLLRKYRIDEDINDLLHLEEEVYKPK